MMPREGELVVSDRLQVAFAPAVHGELYARFGGRPSAARQLCLRLDGAKTNWSDDGSRRVARGERVLGLFLEDDDHYGATSAVVGGARERTREAWFAPDCVLESRAVAQRSGNVSTCVLRWRRRPELRCRDASSRSSASSAGTSSSCSSCDSSAELEAALARAGRATHLETKTWTDGRHLLETGRSEHGRVVADPHTLEDSWAAAAGDEPLVRRDVEYMLIPKTASTILWIQLAQCQQMGDSRRCPNVRIHDHVDGCENLEGCNGSALPRGSRTFVVIRHPVPRFRSVGAHMRRVITDQSSPVFNKSDPELFAWLRATTRHCGRAARVAATYCRVGAVNLKLGESHRVVLWPQTFYFGDLEDETRPKPLVVCFHPTLLVQRINAALAATCDSATPCRVDENADTNSFVRTQPMPTEKGYPTPSELADIYPEDFDLWRRFCADEPPI